jgi:4,5-DOPA dioxygenase extradiol
MTTRDIPSSGSRMPALFIGHGSPMNMVLANGFTRSLADLGPRLPRPEAIMVISAHWLTHGTFVGCMEKPRLIHDFSGFPEELYRVKYDCPGAPAPARQVTGLDGARGLIRCDTMWGLDHASYAVLRHLFPAADIPVFEMSLDYSFNDWHPKQVSYHYKLGRRLRPLRDMGILVIGSGNMVHNLDLVDFANMDAPPFDWAAEADGRMRSHLLAGDHRELDGRGRLPRHPDPGPLPPDDLYPRSPGGGGGDRVHPRRVPEWLCLHEVVPDRVRGDLSAVSGEGGVPGCPLFPGRF